METATQNTIPKEEFHSSKEYLSLTSGQRKWVDIFIETSDPNRATREAYGASDDAYVAMFTRKIESSSRIIAALDLFYGRSPREKFLRDLQNDISRSKGIAKVEARRLYAKMVFGVDGSPSAEAQRFNVGERITERDSDGVEHVGVIRSLDAFGLPLIVDEVPV
jgi:hypothetical protein